MFLFVYKKLLNDEVYVNIIKLMLYFCLRFFFFFKESMMLFYEDLWVLVVDSMFLNFNIFCVLEIKVNKKIYRSVYGKKMSKIILNILIKMIMFFLL